MDYLIKYVLLVILLIFLCSCNNPDTFITSYTMSQNQYDLSSLSSEKSYSNLVANSNNILSTLKIISSNPRPFNSPGETSTLNYLEKTLSSYGYTLESEYFPVYENISNPYSLTNRKDNLSKTLGYSSNLIATHTSSTHIDTNKSLIISAHYDTTATTTGVVDNGSGVSVALEIARLVSSYDLPFNLKFIFWGAEEEGCVGSKEYLDNLTSTEKMNILGCINLDMIGERSNQNIVISTRYSMPNILSLAFNQFLESMNTTPYNASTAGLSDDYHMFKNNIPSFTISNKDDVSLEFLSSTEQISYLDLDMMCQVAEDVSKFIISFDPTILNTLKNTMISTNINDPNISFTQSLFQVTDFLYPNFYLDNMYIDFIRNGSSSILLLNLKSDNNQQYSLLRIPREFLDLKSMINMYHLTLYEMPIYTSTYSNSSTSQIMLQDPLGFYYYIFLGDRNIFNFICKNFHFLL